MACQHRRRRRRRRLRRHIPSPPPPPPPSPSPSPTQHNGSAPLKRASTRPPRYHHPAQPRSTTTHLFRRCPETVMMLPTVVVVLFAVLLSPMAVFGQDATTDTTSSRPVCGVNQLFNGQICTCAPGYFSSANDESKSRCEDECEEVYYSFFTYGKCVGDIFGKLPRDQQPACNLRCGVRPRIWTTVGLFCVFAAALATLLFTIPMCIATCASCLHAKKANKNAKRVMMEQQAQPSKDQQVATMGYNPYAYWPYYGRA